MGWVEKQTMEGMEYYYNADTESVSWEKPDVLKTDDEKAQASGEWVWIPHPTQVWQAGRKIKVKDDGTTKFKTLDDESVYFKVPDAEKKGYFVLKGTITDDRKQKVPVPLWSLNPSSLKFAEEDLVGLDDMNDALISHNLRLRYQKNELYTWVGASRHVLVSINPYKKLPLYTDAVIDMYHNRPPNKHLEPHVYDIAQDSFHTMMFESHNQAILISGESGAGKTEATKQCLGFLAKVAGSDSGVENKILVCNPLLEAFGNAKTIRNINSSRFGKWIEVHFDKTTGSICGAKVTNYLLERSRVVYQQANERNFHIFYQMCSDEGVVAEHNLKAPEDFRYLNQSGITDVEEIDDPAEFSAVKSAMDELGFTPEEQAWIVKITAGVLHLGNVTFEDKQEPGNVSGSAIAAADALTNAATAFSVDQSKLDHVLCYRSISARGDVATIPLKPQDARYACDSLAKGVYGKLFTWLVERVNTSISGKEGHMIGILDVFGFEIFDNNSFEQLCINYANERLQQKFNKDTFKSEEALYLAEGIDFVHIDFIDNQIVLDLVDGRPNGLLPLLDDECVVPEGNDGNYLNKLEKLYKKHSKFQTDKHRKLESSLAFEIEHYAGVVCYNAAEFMAKNVDTLFNDMYVTMGSSTEALTQELFPELGKRVAIQSVSKKFRLQLNDLMKVLDTTDSRYIRCVKPNDQMSANSFNTLRALEQLRYSGVFEAVEIRKKGYPFRLTHKQFAFRYSCINKGYTYETNGEEDDDWEPRCREILKTSSHDFKDVKIGSSRVLYRAPEYKMFTLLHHLALETIVPKMQGAIRAHFAKEFKRRIVRAEAGLQAALDQGNDHAMVCKAIDDVSEIIGSLKSFWSYPPRNIMKAIELKDNLQLWLDFEDVMEPLATAADPNTVYEKLKAIKVKAVKLMHIKRTDHQQELLDKILNLIETCTLGKLDKKADAAWASKNHEDLLAVAKEASALGHITDIIDNIKAEIKDRAAIYDAMQTATDEVDYLRMKIAVKQAESHKYSPDLKSKAHTLIAMYEKAEAEFVELEHGVAEKMKDETRRIHRFLRTKELFYETDGAKYTPYNKCGAQRDPELFAKGAAMMTRQRVGKMKLMDGMLKFQMPKGPLAGLPQPLTMHAAEAKAKLEQSPEEKAQIKKFKMDSKMIFKCITAYMGDKKHIDAQSQGQALVEMGLGQSGLRTEIYFQLIKQLTDNPSSDSTTKGFELLAFCLAAFPPASDFEDWFVMWIRQHAPGGDYKRYTSTLHNTQYEGSPSTVDINTIRNMFTTMQEEGSRFSLPVGAKYTGPTTRGPPEL